MTATENTDGENYSEISNSIGCSEFELNFELCERLVEAASLIPVSYHKDEYGSADFRCDRESYSERSAIQEYSCRGYNVTFFHPSRRMLWRYPDTFILSKSGSRDVFIVFTGTETYDDWFRNIINKSFEMRDYNLFDLYILPGAGGFRSGIRNLLAHNFVSTSDGQWSRDSVLSQHWARFHSDDIDALNEPDAINIYIVGHSQGAAISQFASTVFHGICITGDEQNNNCINYNEEFSGSNLVGRVNGWPLEVRGVFAFAPPMSINRNEYGGGIDHWSLIDVSNIADVSVMVIRDGDMVPTIWNPRYGDGHTLRYIHFGHYIRIDRGGNLDYVENPSWDFDAPHRSSEYCATILSELGGDPYFCQLSEMISVDG